MGQWYEDDQFWLNYAPLMFNDYRWIQAEKEAAQIVKLLKLPKNAIVQDSCCGVGRHTIALAKLGLNMTGVDRTPQYLEAAADTAEAEELNIRFLEADVRNHIEESHYDLIINMFTSFGYFEEEQDQMLYLKNIHGSLKDGGCLLIDTMGKEPLARDFKDCEWFDDGDEKILLEYKILDDFSKIENRWVIVRNNETIDTRFTHRVYSALELKTLLIQAGFNKVRIYGSLEGIPYDHKAERLIAVAEK